MYMLGAELCFAIPGAMSLKDKRQVARSLLERTRHRFNVAIAEVGTQDVHRTLTVGIAVVSGDDAHARDQLEAILRYLDSFPGAELMDVTELESGR
ncbi:DUF503 domain-containing protein [Eubacteriales bacterium OttesenSCG-928-A19]|nr:DUF503 domain-containing protein [Eubacteriales bacterium OttesenSCG-928-A19]